MRSSNENILQLYQKGWEYLTLSLKKEHSTFPIEFESFIFSIKIVYIKTKKYEVQMDWLNIKISSPPSSHSLIEFNRRSK